MGEKSVPNFAKAMSATVFLSLWIAAVPGHTANAPQKCSITYSAHDDVIAAVREYGFKIENYNDVCTWLTANNLEIEIISFDSGVLSDRGFGWAAIKPFKKGSDVRISKHSYATTITKNASSPGAKEALADSISNAIASIYLNRKDFLLLLEAK